MSRKINSSFSLIKEFYHVKTNRELLTAFKDDLIAHFFTGEGSGFFTGILRGIYYRFFLNYKLPAFFGKKFRIINYSLVKLGKNIWIKNDVTIFAGGPLEIGDGCVINERATIWSGPKGLSLGNNVSLGIGSYIAAWGGEIKIADEVRMADHVRMYSWDHKYENTKIPIAEQGGIEKLIEIGYNCWLGSGVMIVGGVSLGEGCVVAAGAVVTKSFPPHCLIGGVPARIIKRIE